jgi:hypothetical protein
MRVYTITFAQGTRPVTVRSVEAAIDDVLTELQAEPAIGQVITIEVGEMTESEYEAIPEWQGP